MNGMGSILVRLLKLKSFEFERYEEHFTLSGVDQSDVAFTVTSSSESELLEIVDRLLP